MARRLKKVKAVEGWVNPTGPAKQVWEYLFGEKAPWGLSVKWVGWMNGAVGLCDGRWNARVLLSYGDARSYERGKRSEAYGPVGVLAHEFLHARGFGRHTKEFKAKERELHQRLGLVA